MSRRAPRRIALALESSGPGGAEQTVLHLASGLRDTAFEPQIVTMRSGWMTQRAEQAGIPFAILPQGRGLDPGWVLRFARWLRRERIDMLHSHEFAMNVYGGAAAVLAHAPHVATVHGRHWVADARRRTLAYRTLRRAGMRLVAVSQDLARFLAERLHLAPDAISVVHNGIPLPARLPDQARVQRRREARRSLGLSEAACVLVAVGNLYPVKDHATLLRATAWLPQVHVAIAGRGEEEQNLRTLANQLGMNERLHLLGLQEDVSTVLLAADIFVHPSRSEGLPLAILEAMASGLPVVATRVGGVPEAVIEGETGLLVPAGDADALARALGSLRGDPARGVRLAEAGRRRAEREFSIAAMCRAYSDLYVSASAAR